MDIFCQIVAQNYDSLHIMEWISLKNYFLRQISIFCSIVAQTYASFNAKICLKDFFHTLQYYRDSRW